MAQTAKPYQCSQKQTAPTLYFCPFEAEHIGLAAAIVIARLRFWLGRSKHVFGGKAWVYNTYADWQKQFPFWSVRTIQEIFLRLQRDGIVEGTNRYNKSKYDRTKWYRLDEDALAERLPEAAKPRAEQPVDVEADGAVSTRAQPAINETAPRPMYDHTDSAPCQDPGRSSLRSSRSACAGEPCEEARLHALETTEPEVTFSHHEEKPVNELDVAYEAIPEAERASWYERAERALAAAGMPEWMRITAVVKEMALRLWVGGTIPVLASG